VRNIVDGELEAHMGRCLRRRRRQLGLSQDSLAGDVGVTFQQIHKYECALTSISASRLWRLAEALHVPVDYFFEGFAAQAVARRTLGAMTAASTAA
jgi:transcriptional regulator with XRE-family HTH domain